MDKHLARIQVTAEPNGYAVWHNMEFDSLQETYKATMARAREIIKEYKPDVSDMMFVD